MQTCGNCDTNNADQFRFCENCGTPLVKPNQSTFEISKENPLVAADKLFLNNLTMPPPVPIATRAQTPIGFSYDQRRQILDDEIAIGVQRGFQVVSRTDTTAQLVKPKKISGAAVFLCILLSLFFGIGLLLLLIYLLLYMAGKPETVYLQVTETGEVKFTKGKLG